ncbi:MAG: DNA mismatch repair protein MutS [Flavobacteriales bacterium]|nr:DNA mismatch repair protein MutS [Flavobacteriales bacterium]
MRQYSQIKAKYPGALVLFRVGDFYETFAEDAINASRVLDIVLTKRANGKASHVELAGFPHHALDNYLPKLVRAGFRVAICDQLEDPSKTKKLVKRGVTELVTPGVTLNDKVLEARSNNYLACLFGNKDEYGISFIDISTGEFLVAEGNAETIEKLLQSLQPSEIVFSKQLKSPLRAAMERDYHTYTLEDWIITYDFGYDRLIQHFDSKNLKGFGVEEMKNAIAAAGACLYYLEQTHHTRLEHVNRLGRVDERDFVWMDQFTIRNLELLSSNNRNGKALLDILDETLTPMGGRLLKRWLAMPLKDLKRIRDRHAVVAAGIADGDLRLRVREQLRSIGDLERLVSKVATGRINPREIHQLGRSLEAISSVKDLLNSVEVKPLRQLLEQINPIGSLRERIASELVDNPPMALNKGEVFRQGVDPELDELRQLAYSGKDTLVEIQQREIRNTGIPSLKIAFNNVFGYYIEVTNTHRDKVPTEWIRKQTLVNAERYITEELKIYENKILNAEDRISSIELRLYEDFVNDLQEYIPALQVNARALAALDCLYGFAEVSSVQNYVIPEMDEGYALVLNECRHPVIETQLAHGEEYVPNDMLLNESEHQLIILTGPNMSGKSALLRQTALAVVMAQIGCFVAAKHAQIGLVDKIYTRVGASDNISQGESTFMVEMIETASILNNLSDRSLILLDEIGRGTSTFDGVSLAWAIAEYLAQHPSHPKTLFATHYHELNELESKSSQVANYHVTTKEVGKKVLFLRKIRRGGSEHSFGIHVAQMAGIPAPVVKRASAILEQLEEDRASISGKETLKRIREADFQLNLFEISDPKLKEVAGRLKALDTNTLTPIEALLKINELKQILSE